MSKAKRAFLYSVAFSLLAFPAHSAAASPSFAFDSAFQNQRSLPISKVRSPRDNFVQSRLEQYLRRDASGELYVDVMKAYISGEDEEVLAVGSKFNNLFAPSHSVDRSWWDPTTWPRYGNWCGKGHSGPGAPINAVDEACKHHDECYAEYGFDDCGCDRTLREEVDRARYAPGVGPDGKIAAEAILLWVSHKSCQWNNL